MLGDSLHPADEGQAVVMPPSANTSHLHIIGPTGSGKSTLLAQIALADASAGRGVLVVEPRGDLVVDILARLPPHRHKDVVVIEPTEFGPVIGLNPLLGPSSQAERRADEIVDLFRTLFGAAVGPRSSDVLLHTLITAARLPDGSMTDVPMLLTNPNFRRRSLAKVTDQLVLAPFWSWYENLSEAERGQVIAPLLNKLRAFTTRAAIRHMLGQSEPKFDLASLFSKKRIILVNLNRGLVGPGTSRLIGSLILTQLWQTIQRRSTVSADQRPPVSIVIDEWQDYVGALDFGEVLAQARGLGVGITLAHQHLGQLSQTLQAAVLANARSRVAFRPSQRDANTLAAALGGGVTAADLELLGPYQAIARLHGGEAPSQPFAIRTLPLGTPTGDPEDLRSKSQRRYGIDGTSIDEHLRARWQGGSDQADVPVGVSRRRTP
ncbi:type IV secretory system conjugative DNA transfer family protein [Kribbella monticola]|uniref:type IV secretory system conjugative DNA transfer family protein n=1 Tax=Kribbella monticola TaxID=2185285 RepID=UPI000DD41E3B|nr:hypothetical protein [Kribbella monticola]